MRAKTDLRKLLLAVVIAIVLSTSTAFATTITLTSMPDLNVSGLPVGPIHGDNAFGYVCNDINGGIYVPTAPNPAVTYTVNVSSFDTLTYVKFRDAGNNPLTEEYKKAAWLLLQMQANPANTTVIQFAIWNIFTPSAPDYAGQAQWITDAYNAVVTNHFNNFATVRIYTPIAQSMNDGHGGTIWVEHPQELMSLVPLPAGAWLLGTGLAGLIAIRRRQARKSRKGA